MWPLIHGRFDESCVKNLDGKWTVTYVFGIDHFRYSNGK